MNGRPLRFLAGITVGWVALRTAMLWPHPAPSDAAPAQVAAIGPHKHPDPSPAIEPPLAIEPAAFLRIDKDPLSRSPLRLPRSASTSPPIDLPIRPPLRSMMSTAASTQVIEPLPSAAPPPRNDVARWSASIWLLLRDGRGIAPGLGKGELGGGQAGLRVAWEIDRKLAIVARVASPVTGKGREAAIGLEWKPTRLPIRIVAERRFSLDGGTGGPLVGLVGGTGPAPIAAGFDLETYGQAGVIRRNRTEPFADGAARLTRLVAHVGKTRIDLGIGAWGGAQRDAQRLDLGPTAGVRLPIAGRTIRLLAGWRQRVAGKARPGSGPSLTIGSDF